MCFWATCLSSLKKCSFKSFCSFNFYIRLFVFCFCRVIGVSSIFFQPKKPERVKKVDSLHAQASPQRLRMSWAAGRGRPACRGQLERATGPSSQPQSQSKHSPPAVRPVFKLFENQLLFETHVPNCYLKTDGKHCLQRTQERVIPTLVMVPLSCSSLLQEGAERKSCSWKNTFKRISARKPFAHLFLTGFSWNYWKCT